MEIIDNTQKTLRDDLSFEIHKGSKLSIAAACFSIYAFQELKDALKDTQAQLVELYQTSKSNVSEHIKNIFTDGELDENSVVREFRTTAADGKDYNTKHYNLDNEMSTSKVRYHDVDSYQNLLQIMQSDLMK